MAVDDPGQQSGKNGAFHDEGPPSDMFRVRADVPSIPVVSEIPEHPAIIRRRKIIRVASIATAIATAIGLVALTVFLIQRSRLHAALDEAAWTGRTAAIERALSLLGDSNPPLQARLISTLALAGEPPGLDRAAELVGSLEDTGDSPDLETRMARTYLALARNDPQAAWKSVPGEVPSASNASEAVFARASAALARGDLSQAELDARTAVSLAPESPRYSALLAIVVARKNLADAIKALKALPEHAANAPSVSLAKARIFVAGRNASSAKTAIDALLSANDVTARERSWALALRGRLRAEAGDFSAARADARKAAPPPGDEAFRLALAETWLIAEDADGAERELKQAPIGISTNGPLRAQVAAWIALSRGKLDQAKNRLRQAGDGPKAQLLRARLHGARGNVERAEQIYRSIAKNKAYLTVAHAGLAALLVENGRAEDAVPLMEKVLKIAPNHPEFVPIAVRAQIRAGHPEQAMKLAHSAVRTHPRNVRVLAGLARAQALLGRHRAALESARKALKSDDRDPDLHALRGEAARKTGAFDESDAAFQRALKLKPQHAEALMGRLALMNDTNNVAEGAVVLKQIQHAELNSRQLDVERARHWVLAGEGFGAMRRMQAVLRRQPKEAALRLAMAELQLQAELFGAAERMFARAALLSSEDPREARIGSALALARAKKTHDASVLVNSLEQELSAAGRSKLPGRVRARLLVAAGRVELQRSNTTPAAGFARRALKLDAENSEAQLLLADIAEAKNRDPSSYLRKSLAARAPRGEGAGRLALRMGPTTEGCEHAKRYRSVARTGSRARWVNSLYRRCR